MRKNKHRGIENLKSRYGLMFIAPWFLGFVLFFAIPVFQSVWFSLSDVTLSNNGLVTKFVGLSHYRYALLQSGAYTATLGTAVTSLLYQLPIIVLISMVLSLILNQKFRGRTFFRALFFLPVIIATGIVMDFAVRVADQRIGIPRTDENARRAVQRRVAPIAAEFDGVVSDVAAFLDLPSGISDYAEKAISNIFDLIWSSGIQTVLFIAGLQSVPSSLYEASRVEGATKWEEFWFITFPSLSQVTLLVIIYTMVEQFTSSRNPMINAMYTLMKGGNYDETSAVLWFYFALVGIIMGILIWAYNRFLVKRWS